MEEADPPIHQPARTVRALGNPDAGSEVVDQVIESVADGVFDAAPNVLGAMAESANGAIGEILASPADGAIEAAAQAAGALLESAGDSVGDIAGAIIGGILESLGS